MQQPASKRQTPQDELSELLTLWPEWVDAEVVAEKYSTKHPFEDPDGIPLLPAPLRRSVDNWKRVSELDDGWSIFTPAAMDDTMHTAIPRRHAETTLAKDQDESIAFKLSITPSQSKFMAHNSHLLASDLMRCILIALHYLHEQRKSSDDLMPWDSIYPKSKDGLSLYNPSGKYSVKLYWLGAWRKITVDDKIPLDASNRPLLISSPCTTELWPLLLSKALVKIAAQSYRDESEFGDFNVLCALRGFIPEKIPVHGDLAALILSFSPRPGSAIGRGVPSRSKSGVNLLASLEKEKKGSSNDGPGEKKSSCIAGCLLFAKKIVNVKFF